ncbi:MAG: class I SAM-dependent methyltransferase [Candidatus Merdivicinus sp.]|jgi:SAM-dependent methyltransferase
MTREECKVLCTAEERAFFNGWNFAHLNGRWIEEPLPWDFQQEIQSVLNNESIFLDLASGGYGFLLSLNPQPGQAFYAETDEATAAILRQRFAPYGVEVRQIVDEADLPFSDEKFDVVYTRYGSFCPAEAARVLKKGGIFLTQQSCGVDGRFNGIPFSGWEKPVPERDLTDVINQLEEAGFLVLKGQEAYPAIRFEDIGALVYWIHAAGWQSLAFSAENREEELWKMQQSLEENGGLVCREHRFFVMAKKL